MDILFKILSFILFLVALGVLVAIHELGHLLAAKAFNVYCSDFSIGFGPKIVKFKRKGGETKYSLGIVPFGGYVAMYGEGTELPEGVNVPKSRSLEGIKRWKKIIVFSAGIVMNFVLAYLIFFICASCFKQLNNDFSINVMEVTNVDRFNQTFKNEDGSLLTLDEKTKLDAITVSYKYHYVDIDGVKQSKEISNLTLFVNEGIVSNGKTYTTVYDTSNFGYNDMDFTKFIAFYEAEPISNEEKISDVKVLTGQNEYTDYSETKYKDINLSLPIISSQNSVIQLTYDFNTKIEGKIAISDMQNETKLISMNLKGNENGTLNSTGFSSYARWSYAGWDSFRIAGEKWVNATTAISDALGKMFIGDKETWSGVGGPVAIFTQTTTILTNFPFNYYLETWGLISVNLALFNLLPFPGLDGWQILVEIIEGIGNFFYKKFKKVKNKPENERKEIIEAEVISDESNDSKIIVGTKKEEEKNEEEWKIPSKLKNIVSTIGLIILFGFMIVILFKDLFF